MIERLRAWLLRRIEPEDIHPSPYYSGKDPGDACVREIERPTR